MKPQAKLDKVDFEILDVIEKKGLFQAQDIAQRLKKSLPTISRRLNSLIDKDIIQPKGYIINWQNIQTTKLLAFQLILNEAEEENALKTLQKAREVLSIYQLRSNYAELPPKLLIMVALPQDVDENLWIREHLAASGHFSEIITMPIEEALKENLIKSYQKPKG